MMHCLGLVLPLQAVSGHSNHKNSVEKGKGVKRRRRHMGKGRKNICVHIYVCVYIYMFKILNVWIATVNYEVIKKSHKYRKCSIHFFETTSLEKDKTYSHILLDIYGNKAKCFFLNSAFSSPLTSIKTQAPIFTPTPSSSLKVNARTSLVVQWLGLCASNAAGGPGSIPGWGTKIPHAVWCSKKNARNYMGLTTSPRWKLALTRTKIAKLHQIPKKSGKPIIFRSAEASPRQCQASSFTLIAVGDHPHTVIILSIAVYLSISLSPITQVQP